MRVRPSSIPLMSTSKDNQNCSEVENKRDAPLSQLTTQQDDALIAKKVKKASKPTKTKKTTKSEKTSTKPESSSPVIEHKVIEIGPKAPMVSFSMVK